MTKLHLLIILSFIVPFWGISQSEVEEALGDSLLLQQPDTTQQISSEFIEEQSAGFFADDSPIVKMLDSLYKIRYFGDSLMFSDTASQNLYGYNPSEIPVFTDSVYAQRIAALDRETPIPMVFNKHVKGFIDLYAVRKRGLTSRMLGLAHVYFPMFEELLDRYDIPL